MPKNNNYFIVILLFLSFLIPNDIGLIKNLKFIDGLSSNNITEISIDNYNRAWIGTYNGISMFNGHEFINYYNEDSISEKNINAIYIHNENIWFGTNDGIQRISKINDQFIVTNFINYNSGIYDLIKRGNNLFSVIKNKLLIFNLE